MRTTCSAEGCQNRVNKGASLCTTHYRRQRDADRSASRCTAAECERAATARGFCQRHYVASRKLDEAWPRCSFDGCRGARRVKGLCSGHYYQQRQGRPLVPLRPAGRALCSMPGCDRTSSAQRLCSKHYYRWRANGDPAVTKVAAKGQGCLDRNGYRVLLIDGRQMSEHRWVMEQLLGRPLYKDERVHHINGVRDDNRLENLELWSVGHPAGQRVEDKVDWALEILRRYAPERLA